MLRVILVRHGESVNNLERNCSGWVDYKLTEKGREQAGKAALFLKYYPIKEAYSSDLVRTVDTAQIILQNHPNVVLSKCSKFREVNVGIYEGLEEGALHRAAKALKLDVYYFKPFRGESFYEKDKRVRELFDLILGGGERTFLIVGHGGTIVPILQKYIPLPFEENRAIFRGGNCAISVIEFENCKVNIPLLNYTGYL